MAADRRPEAEPSGIAKLRLDRWLWAARFYRTRSLAAEAIDAGQVRVDAERVKPARAVRAGDRVQVNKGGLVWDVGVLAVSDRRGSAADAAKLYLESESGRAAREAEIERRRAAAQSGPQFGGRPTKRQRRKLEDFLNEP
jgi:ribosome-associated heat shock protein Hsp15